MTPTERAAVAEAIAALEQAKGVQHDCRTGSGGSMSARDVILHALIDAIDWQLSLADAHSGCADGQAAKSLGLVADYRKLMKRRYGTDQTPMERRFDGTTSVRLIDIVAKPARAFDQSAPSKAGDMRGKEKGK